MVEITPPPDAPQPGSAPWKAFSLAVVGVTLLRLAAAATIPLSGDEAYYWTWTRHLALGYHDHPPMVAWIIAVFTGLLGTSTLAVRLPFVLLGSATACLSFALGWMLGGTRASAWWAGLLPLMVPLFTLAGMGVFPDSPLIAASAAFFVCAWRATEAPGPSLGWWTATGVCAGLAFLSKLIGLYLIPALLVYLVVQPARRRHLRCAGPYIAIVTALAVASPFLYWNVTHGFESVVYQFSTRLGSSSARRSPQTLKFVLLSSVAVSPVLYVMLIAAIARATRRGLRGDAGALFIVCMAAPLHLVFLAASLVTKVGLHWTAAGTLAAFSSFGTDVAAQAPRRRQISALVGAALALAVSGLVYIFALAPARLVSAVSEGAQLSGVNHGRPLKTGEITEILGFPEMGEKVRDLAAETPSPFLITTSYALSSTLWFYSGQPFHVIMGTRIGAQYDHWDDFPSLLGRDAIYIDTSPIDSREDVWSNLREAFEEVSLAPAIVAHGGGIEARTFYVARCRGFRKDVFTPLQSIHRP